VERRGKSVQCRARRPSPPRSINLTMSPEPNFFTVGMKSYGRAPMFLDVDWLREVRSVVAALVGDWEAAGNVEQVLPETAVCSTDAGGGGGCGSSTNEITAASVVSEAELLVELPRSVSVLAGVGVDTATGEHRHAIHVRSTIWLS